VEDLACPCWFLVLGITIGIAKPARLRVYGHLTKYKLDKNKEAALLYVEKLERERSLLLKISGMISRGETIVLDFDELVATKPEVCRPILVVNKAFREAWHA
jgi:hypothetical protein